MREIKFRAWDTISESMLAWGDLLKENLKMIFSSTKETNVKLMQFTGLLDKNGKEIYEGDLISMTKDKTPTAQIIYDYSGFKYKWIDKITKIIRTPKEHIFMNNHLFEVIGNIHENPELLNQES